jgi:hypothetical protein
VLQTVKPALAEKIDPGNAILSLAQGHQQALVDHDPRGLGGSGCPWRPAQ